MQKTLVHFTLFLTFFLLTACHSSQTAVKGTVATATSSATASSAEKANANYVSRIKANAQTAQTVTAHLKVSLALKDKNVSLNGTLRMKRDDVVQLSLSLLGFELARMEFSPKDVLLIDRYNQRYVRASYADVKFLKQANLDFSVLQALFWGELFVPGKSGEPEASDFRLSSAGDHTLLVLSDASGLDYDFITKTASAVLSSVTVCSKDPSRLGKFEWSYGETTALNGKPFPTAYNCAVSGLGKDGTISFDLSRIGNDTGWTTHTELSSKYKEVKADDLLKSLLK